MIKKIQEETIPQRWRSDLVRDYRFPPLLLEWVPTKRQNGQGDAFLTVRAERDGAEFTGLYVRDATPKRIAEAATQVSDIARRENRLPLLLAPYLSGELLLELEKQSLSALDLSGNGTIKAPGKFSVFRTGLPNRFTTSRPLKNVYQGTSSLVARAFLFTPNYASVSKLQEEIVGRGGVISLPTVSKALTELEADLIVRRERREQTPQARSLRLLNPEKLLTRLSENYVPPKVRRAFVGKVDRDADALQQALREQALRGDVRLIATGVGSATRYAALAMEKTVYLYTDSIETLLEGLPVVETNRFPNLNLQETDDPTVYFDPRTDEGGFPWASPVTAYLEMNDGEARLRQSAEQVKERLLQSLEGRTK